MSRTTLYVTRRILTMDPARPEATHVAVRDGLILGVGSAHDLRAWGPMDLDDRFADKVLLPGFVEGHCHMLEGVYWRYPYCGYFDRRDPNGKVWTGARSIEDIVKRLRKVHAAMPDKRQPLFAWGFDPLYFGSTRVSRHDLDRVSKKRPIVLHHANGHVSNANSAALDLVGYLRKGLNHEAIPLGEDGLPAGELRRFDAWEPLLRLLGVDFDAVTSDADGLRAYARLAVRAGVTTATDLANPQSEAVVKMMLAVTSDAHFPMRLVPAMIGRDKEVVDLVAYTKACRDRSTDRLRMGLIKLAADGSIQANTARLLEPGYLTGPRNGMWYMPREWIEAVFVEALREGVQIHIHTNGDQAVQLAIDAFDAAARKTPASDHRFSLQHCQLANRAQLRQMARLGLCANFFSNHTYYYGDLHATLTVGPDRAERMNPCRSAQDFGVPYTIHADAPVTPMNPLHVAWCAVNRSTMSGRLLGEYERISVIDALRAITLGSAYTLRLDHEIGSIECGKRADFAVLEDDPLELPSEKLKDVGVWGTVQGGRVFDAASI